jgi:hypothetical protein
MIAILRQEYYLGTCLKILKIYIGRVVTDRNSNRFEPYLSNMSYLCANPLHLKGDNEAECDTKQIIISRYKCLYITKS